MFIGSDLNKASDALIFGDFSDRWIDAYLPYRDGGLPAELEAEMLGDLEATLSTHLAELGRPSRRPWKAQRRWGWKEPRSIFLLPFFDRHLPSLRFLHVVRDGRDMALSTNQAQLRKHGEAAGVGGEGAVESITLWQRINLETADYGERVLGDRYLRVRFEDLCVRPEEEGTRVLEFFGLDTGTPPAVDEVSPPSTIGRWQSQDPATVRELERVAGPALARFGYEPGRRNQP